ncbi:glycosyltransferase family 2 protein [Ammoniphilus sp. 3BR4]|uniref:glycosyltransferase family 2 protein n=1 Tax=Ammoniphilus sp. 3BR4 TaxID=3158265 RepID=UPI003465426F
MKKAFSITMVKNEADIIESFVRYHLNIFDRMVILDNGSTDCTLTILNNLKAEGLPIDVLVDNFEYLQAEKTTSLMYSTYREYKPDLIFPLDVDEFLILANNKEHPRKIIDKLDLETIYYLERVNYIPSVNDNYNELFVPKRITHSLGRCDGFKVVVTKGVLNKYSPSISKGNHNLIFKNKREHPKIERPFGALKIAHFIVRSPEQMKSKVILGWLNNLAAYNRKKGNSVHLEKWFNRIKANPNIGIYELLGSPKKVEPIDLSFCKPIHINYTNHNDVNLFRNLLLFSELLAAEYAKVRKKLIDLEKR